MTKDGIQESGGVLPNGWRRPVKAHAVSSLRPSAAREWRLAPARPSLTPPRCARLRRLREQQAPERPAESPNADRTAKR